MAVLLQSPASLPLSSRVASPSRPDSMGLWLLTGCLFLLLIVGRITSYNAVNRTASKHSASTMVLPQRSFQAPAGGKPQELLSATPKP